MKENFICPKCKQKIKVGRRLHSKYTCCNCHNQFMISREEKMQGHVKYKRNFLLLNKSIHTPSFIKSR